MPKVHLIDMRNNKQKHIVSMKLYDEIKKRIASNQQTALFLNRRGYAPVTSAHPVE